MSIFGNVSWKYDARWECGRQTVAVSFKYFRLLSISFPHTHCPQSKTLKHIINVVCCNVYKRKYSILFFLSYTSFSLSFCLSFSPFFILNHVSVRISVTFTVCSIQSVSLCLLVWLSNCVCMSVLLCLYTCISAFISVTLLISIYLSVLLWIYLAINYSVTPYIYVSVSIYLSYICLWSQLYIIPIYIQIFLFTSIFWGIVIPIFPHVSIF